MNKQFSHKHVEILTPKATMPEKCTKSLSLFHCKITSKWDEYSLISICLKSLHSENSKCTVCQAHCERKTTFSQQSNASHTRMWLGKKNLLKSDCRDMLLLMFYGNQID